MFSLNDTERYYLSTAGIDLRKGFDALCGVVRSDMGRDPLSGEVFIFLNKSRTTLKLLHWEPGGLVLYHKRLECGRFSLPVFNRENQCYAIGWTDLVLMVEGLSAEHLYRKKRFVNLTKTT